MGAITGGMFIQYRGESRSPVNVYLPGCPPKQEAVIYAITKIRKRYRNQTTNHFLNVGRIILEITIKVYQVDERLKKKSYRYRNQDRELERDHTSFSSFSLLLWIGILPPIRIIKGKGWQMSQCQDDLLNPLRRFRYKRLSRKPCTGNFLGRESD